MPSHGMGLSIKQAMALTKRSRATLYRWKADGCDISDEHSLRQFSDFADMNARGRSAQLAQDREPLGKASKQLMGLDYMADALSEWLADFKNRLAGTSDEEERGSPAEEVGHLEEARRLINLVAEGYR